MNPGNCTCPIVNLVPEQLPSIVVVVDVVVDEDDDDDCRSVMVSLDL